MSDNFDLSEFRNKLAGGGEKMLAAAAAAVDRFSEHVVGDAQQLCPVLTGTLAGSGVPGRTAAEVAADIPVEQKAGSISKTIGFNTDYAAAVHENLTAHHTQGGAKFLTNAISGDAPKMAPYVAEQIKAAGF